MYTINFFYLAYRSQSRSARPRPRINVSMYDHVNLPKVTLQLPLYNERYVAKRLIDAVCALDYPKDKLQIQVLDDSDDDTVDLIRSIIGKYRAEGFDITHMHRANRVGYKAGALKAGMNSATGEFMAIFDADFIPPTWFLKRTLGYFLADPTLGFVQCKWGHVNENYSTLTEAQALSLDLHFLVEQKAKSLSHLFMNFNGTAGIWRSKCISACGGWHLTTLVEDLDLSYRAQLLGWKCAFLEDLVIDAELPVQMNAAKRQQFRWSKGSIQVALKLMGDIAVNRRISPDTKFQAFIQMTRPIVNPLSLTQFLILPMLLAMDFKLYNVSWGPAAVIAVYLLMGPGGYIMAISRIWSRGKWQTKAKQFVYLMLFASGLSVNTSVAVFDALFGRQNEFLRTPKFGVVNKNDDWRNKAYVLPFTKTTLLEIFFAIYGCVAVFISIFSGNPVYAPILAITTSGFVYVSYLSIAHSSFRRKVVETKAGVETSPPITRLSHSQTQTEIIRNWSNSRSKRIGVHRLLLPGLLCFLVLGAGVAFYGYTVTIYPLNTAAGYLVLAETSQSPEQMAEYLSLASHLLPQSGNPVWLFPTPRTDFANIQMSITSFELRSKVLSNIGPEKEEYNAEMLDIKQGIEVTKLNIVEAVPYSYISIANIASGGAWVAVIMGIFAGFKKVGMRERRPKATPTRL